MKNLAFFCFLIVFISFISKSSIYASSTNSRTNGVKNKLQIETVPLFDDDIDMIVNQPDPPGVSPSSQDVVIGTTNFTITVTEFNEDEVRLDYQTSSNITRISVSTDYSKRNCCQILYHTYTFQITGDQSGWVKFKSMIPFYTPHSEWATATINRKLNSPSISGESKICSNGSSNTETYTITADSQSESFTYTVTDGLRIKNGSQFLTTYTGTEISVDVFDYSNNSVKGSLKVKAHASNYVDSNENIKSITIGIPDYTKLDIHLDGGDLLACDYTSADVDYDGTAGILGYEWDIQGTNDWEITEESGAGPDNTYVEIEYWEDPTPSTEDIYVRAQNTCGWSLWNYETFNVTDNCGSYLMMVSPNPANEYVDLTFVKEENITSSKNKVKIKKTKKNKDDELSEYLVQILDKDGVIRKSVQSKNLNLNISTRDIEPGNYFLHLSFGKETYKQQLVIY